MTRVISAFEAPALLDAHPTLTRYSLYERLIGPPQSFGAAGLATCLADGAMRFAQNEYRWATPVNKRFELATDCGILVEGRAFVTSDQVGPLVVTFLHLADYLHRASWGKAGVPPYAFQIQANWIMWLSGHDRLAFLVLSDKRLTVYEVQRDDALIQKIADGVTAMAAAIETNSPPPMDAEIVLSEAAVPDVATDNAPADLDDLVRRFRLAREAKAVTANSATFAEHAAEAASNALKSALPQGKGHEVDGTRTYHNAKNGRLTEEKIDGTYF